MKRLLLAIPFTILLVGCGKKIEYLKYELNIDGTYTAYLEDDSFAKKVTVPKTYKKQKVTQISGFRNNEFIEEVTFSSNITTIDEGTFTFCPKLKMINAVKNETFKTIDGSLYKGESLYRYASGRTEENVTITSNILSKAFTLAPNIKELSINSQDISDNAVYYLENLETIYLGENVKALPLSFQTGNLKLEKLIINNKNITNDITTNTIKTIYVLEDAILNDYFLANYEYKKDAAYNKVAYKVYEVK